MKQRIGKDLIRRRYAEHSMAQYDKDGIEATFRMGLQVLAFYGLISRDTYTRRLAIFHRNMVVK